MYHRFSLWPPLGIGLPGNVNMTGVGVLPGTYGALRAFFQSEVMPQRAAAPQGAGRALALAAGALDVLLMELREVLQQGVVKPG